MTTDTRTNNIKSEAEAVERRYNAEHDLTPGAPDVTWSDYQLLGMIRRLVMVVEDLQDQIDQLKAE